MATEIDDGALQKNGVGGGLNTYSNEILEPKHKVFLSHSGAQKDFAEQLCVDLETFDRYPFFDKRRSSLPIGEGFVKLIFDAIQQCQIGVLILSKDFFTKTKWPMIELVAMVKELEKPDSKIKIIPVFYHISRQDYVDISNLNQWVSQWEEWANEDKRICVEEWKRALAVLKGINSLVINGIGEVKARKLIVDAVCELLLPETRWDDSHVEGKLRLCEVLRNKINEDRDGVRVIGLYGMGGVGKTTICRAMCNELFQEFQGRVNHAELENNNGVGLLREVLKKFTNKRHEVFGGLQIDQCRDQLKRNLVQEAVFLAIDNVSDNPDSITNAKTYLAAKWAKGSVIIVTARSLDTLLLLHQYIEAHNCIEMPGLEKDEAKSLFLKHVICGRDDTIEMDEELVKSCVERCYFSKGVGHHYIPLALKVLGEQLGCIGYDADRWKAQLNKVETFELELFGTQHPIFSILRTSFDSLPDKAQMLFMDVALFIPGGAPPHIEQYYTDSYNLFDWLSMVHGVNIDEMVLRMEGLKRKSLIEKIGDGTTKVVMHDLWHEFCVAESKVGKFKDRRWVFLEEASSELREVSPPGRCWEHLRRMCFLNEGWKGLHRLHLKDFLNVTVLKLEIQSFIPPNTVRFDLRGLKHLKSLEVNAKYFKTKCVGLGSLRNLVFLSWVSLSEASSRYCEEIGHLTKLQGLAVVSDGEKLPDLSMMTSLRVAVLHHSGKFVAGLSSKLSNLRYLSLRGCFNLQECPGLGGLYALEELNLSECRELKKVPCLRLLTLLKELNISFCKELRVVPGLDGLVALERLLALGCYKLDSLPDMQKVTKLERLECSGFSDMSVLDIGTFPELKVAAICSCRALKSVTCSKPLRALTNLQLSLCSSLEELPDLRNFPRLKELWLCGCKALMSLIISVPLHGLEILDLQGCSSLSALPDHLSGSVGLRELRLQQSGVMLSGEDTRELETSCKSLKVFLSSAKSVYGNEYVTIADRSRDESGTTEFDLQNGWRSRSLPDSLPTNKITRIIYSNAGGFIMALTSDGMHKRWDWENEATVSVAPHLWKPAEGVRMINVNTGMVNPEEVVPCMALAWNDFQMVSASGGEASVYTIEDTELHFRSIQTPSAATSLAFHPKFQEVVVVGMEDSTIQIYDASDAPSFGHYQFHAVCTLTGHQKRITGLGFSLRFNVLVSVGADAQLCVWKLEEWSKRHSRFGPLQPDRRTPCMGDICVQFRNARRDLMVVGKSQLVVYDFQNLGAPFVKWVPQSPFGAALSDATYSCDGKLVYASFVDGSIAVLSAHYLEPLERLAFPIYPPRGVSGSTVSYPMAIAAHPNRPCQFAVGLSDGSVTVLEFSRAPAGEESESRVATTSAAVVQDRPIADEKDEEPRIPDTDVARCGCLDYCSCVFFTSAFGDCSGSSSGVTGTDTSKDESGGVEINMQKKYQSRRLPDTLPLHEVISLIYSDAGDSLVAITSNGLHKRWDWENEAAVSFAPHLWCPDNGALVTKDINYNRPGEVVSCMARFRDSCHMIAASGGEVVVFHILNTKVINTTIQTPSAATCLSFHPHQEHIIVIGMEDSTIQIYDNRLKEVLCTLEGHQKRIISLVFSTAFNVLVSLGADAQMCLWKVEEWSKQQLNSGPLQPDRRTPCVGDLRVQFRNDKRGLLAVAKSQLAVYDVLNWDRPVAQWILPSSSTSSITDATFSCDGRSVYAAFSDGYVDEFSAYDLRRVSEIRPPIRTPQGESGSILYPLAIAAHPKKPGQIALGMSDGTVLVVEPWKAPEDNEPGSGPTVISQEHRRIDQIEEEGEDGDVQLAHCGCLDHFLTFFSTR